jgi:acetyl-CoA carboxylase/biotin carboxylase 1
MEMYADKEARGGVLEPEGIVEIKFRRDKVLATMERLDAEYARLKAASTNASSSPEEQAAAKEKLAVREKHLMPTYQQIALLYSDLHDRSGRMEAKGCARPADWPEARRYFYWRLRRRLNEHHMLSKIATAHPELSAMERKEFLSEIVQTEDDSDQAVAQFIEANAHLVTEEAARLRSDYVADKILGFAETDRDGLLQGFSRIMESLSEEERAALVERFTPNGHA